MARYLLLLFLLFTLPWTPAWAEPRSYNAPEGSISSLMIFERGDFARAYGLFVTGVGRIVYDDQTKILGNIKLAFLTASFVSNIPTLKADLFGAAITPGSEVAFVQSEPARFDTNKISVKGDLIINGIRRPLVFQAELNKYGRINQSTDVSEDGAMTMGLSLHGSFKRSDFGLSTNKENSVIQDDVIIMFDIVARE